MDNVRQHGANMADRSYSDLKVAPLGLPFVQFFFGIHEFFYTLFWLEYCRVKKFSTLHIDPTAPFEVY